MFFGIRYQVLLRNYITIILHHIGKMNGVPLFEMIMLSRITSFNPCQGMK